MLSSAFLGVSERGDFLLLACMRVHTVFLLLLSCSTGAHHAEQSERPRGKTGGRTVIGEGTTERDGRPAGHKRGGGTFMFLEPATHLAFFLSAFLTHSTTKRTCIIPAPILVNLEHFPTTVKLQLCRSNSISQNSRHPFKLIVPVVVG